LLNAQTSLQVDLLITKEREKQEKIVQKHSVIVESYERKLSSKEIDNRIAPYQQKIVVLNKEIDEALQSLDEL
jgi:oligosaccharyltransferase complex subunit alpha (ribophorin I)